MLDQLETKYFDTSSGASVYRGNTKVEPIIDGQDYFKQVCRDIIKTSNPDDYIFILAWRLDPDTIINPTENPSKSLGELLVEKANIGVDVRIILNGNIFAHNISKLPMSANLDAAIKLRNWVIPPIIEPPLKNKVFYDFSGSITGSHHQKSFLIKAGDEVVAYVAGIDPSPKVIDKAPHNFIEWPANSKWGWHDIAIKLTGEGVKAVWNNFRSRWFEAKNLLPKSYLKKPPAGDWLPSLEPFNPSAESYPDMPDIPQVQTVTSNQSVQVTRSRFRFKYPNFFLPCLLGDPWKENPNGSIYEVYSTLIKAINNATKFIYIEDQYLADKWTPMETGDHNFSLFDALLTAAEQRGVKLIFVGSGRNDPEDYSSAEFNKTFEEAGDVKEKIFDRLSDNKRNNIAVYRLKNITVHSKLIIIDDTFLAIGSANMMSRSMMGVDSELHVAVVDSSKEVVQRFRKLLWYEHLGINQTIESIDRAMENIDQAIGIWNNGWLPEGDRGMWTTSGNPSGFEKKTEPLEFIGPRL